MTLHIVGGTYIEQCAIAESEEFRGSGGRAAVALSPNILQCVLHTYGPASWAAQFEDLSRSFDVKINRHDSDYLYCFDYFHPASEPKLYPNPTQASSGNIVLSEQNVLVYGMVEGQADIKANKLVYDPQSPGNPIPFEKNKFVAKKYAIVANSSEAKRMTGLDSIENSGRKLLADGADVVVIKRGAFGLSVFLSSGTTHIPAFRTAKVWPIGSGDIFSAVFAAYWTQFGDPLTAAEIASKATAYYCLTRVLPLPDLNYLKSIDFPLVDPSKTKEEGVKQVYLAGPFFTTSQRWLVEETKKILEAYGLRVFSPLHEVGFGKGADVAIPDLIGLDKSDVLFAILDGYDPGTMFEIGYAKAQSIPVVAYIERPSDPGITMVEGSGCEIVNDLTSGIYRTVWI